MPNGTGETLRRKKTLIMRRWAERARLEIQESLHQTELALNNSMEEFLDQLAAALNLVPESAESEGFNREMFSHFARGHGSSRAGMKNYTIEGLIREYHILRQTTCDLLEEEHPLSPREREVITSVIEQAVNDAAAQYSRTLRDLQERLTATLVHDLRSPLSAAQLSVQLIERHPGSPEFCVRHARKIQERLAYAASMIDDVLDVSQLTAGQMPAMPPEHCDLAKLLKRIAADTNQQHPGRARVRTSGDLTGYWNPRAITRIVDNLLGNALKHGAAGEPVELQASGTADKVIIRVHNLGPAISPADQATVFQAFHRTKLGQTRKGWGLGLVVVKALTEALRGSARVESSAEAGTTFTVTLPKGERPSQAAG